MTGGLAGAAGVAVTVVTAAVTATVSVAVTATTAAAAALTAAESQPVTRWPERLAGTALMLAVVAGICLLFLRGWRRRAARDAGLPPPLPAPPVPPGGQELGGLLVAAEGSYVSTTHAGDWLDRVAAHGLGVRGDARMAVGWAGVLWERTGAPEVYVPAEALQSVRLDRGMAGKFVEEDGLVVVTWQAGPTQAGATQAGATESAARLDTGFRPREAAVREELLAAVQLVLRSREAAQGGAAATEER